MTREKTEGGVFRPDGLQPLHRCAYELDPQTQTSVTAGTLPGNAQRLVGHPEAPSGRLLIDRQTEVRLRNSALKDLLHLRLADGKWLDIALFGKLGEGRFIGSRLRDER